MSPVISVVLPTFNRAGLLKRALLSVISQTYANWEVLVIDNNSTDDTDQVVHGLGDERIKILKVHNHGVIALSRNVGIKAAHGTYIAFLDSDDWWKSDKLKKSLAYLEKGNDLVYATDITINNSDIIAIAKKRIAFCIWPCLYSFIEATEYNTRRRIVI